MRRPALVLTALTALAAACGAGAAPDLLPPFDAPETQRWINSPPLSAADLGERPVLVEFWAFGCHNCRNTLPWLKRVADLYGPRGLVIVAVHTPEFASERGRSTVEAAVKRLGVRYPVLLDDDSAIWSAMNNRYWPAFYLYDRKGRLAATRIGELHSGRRDADSLESEIERLLRSPSE